MSDWIDDLTPYFDDPCYMFVLMARGADTAVIMRRAAGKWWLIVKWDTRLDRFEKGQWFHGSFYPEKCDLSPDGKLFVYFAGKHRRSNPGGYGDVWTAVSRPPYLTALALWPSRTGTWLGGGRFVDNQTLEVPSKDPHHPDHPPGPLRLIERSSSAVPGWKYDWEAGRKRAGNLLLSCVQSCYEAAQRRGWRGVYALHRTDGPPASFEAHWADFDQHGRLVATVGGRVFEGRAKSKLEWHQLVDFSTEKPERMEAAEWAQRW